MNQSLTKDTVPLRTGPPTREELMVYYPAKYTWEQLKIFVNSGDLGTLRRDHALHLRYEVWMEGIKKKYGTMENYVLNHRLRWGQVDTMSLLRSSLDLSRLTYPQDKDISTDVEKYTDSLIDPPYFSIKTPSEYISIIQNDWPVPVPVDVEHSLVWTKLPIYHPLLVADSIKARIDQDGMWGFTGIEGPPEMPKDMASWLSTVSGVTPHSETMIKSAPPMEGEFKLLQKAAAPVQEFVESLWVENEWEAAWFVNPARLQSVPGLAHIHVFAKRK